MDPETITDDDKPPQTGHTFNIWFLKWAGGDSNTRNYVKLKFRVNIKRDSGYTKASENSPLCLFFARGCCYRGRKCPYLHCLPKDTDYGIPTQDCFGRDKTADYRDDMDGVGLLARTNRTLYVAGIHMSDQAEEMLTKNFLEFGSIDAIRVLYGKSCAFITFRLESEAQFAKEALQSQSLEGTDVLTIKWANDDPNPNAQLLTKRHMEEIAMETVKKLLGKKQKTGAIPKEVKQITETEEETQDAVEVSGLLGGARLAALQKITVKPVTQKPAALLTGYSSDEEE